MIAAFLIAAAIVFPSVQPGDVLGALGIGSVAIGFAFKDVLQNLLAGLLILIRRPYTIGDEIVVDNYEGRVEHIESRATMIRTYDGRRVVIPNSDIYTKAVTVNTAYPTRRDEYNVGIGYGDDPMLAAEIFRQAARDVAGVLMKPPAECFPWEAGGKHRQSEGLVVGLLDQDGHCPHPLACAGCNLQGGEGELDRPALPHAGHAVPRPD